MRAIPVLAYCPMGCGQYIQLNDLDRLVCTAPDCPDPGRLDQIVNDPETEHVVAVTDDGWSLKHPLRERAEGELFDCELHQYLMTRIARQLRAAGRYRVTKREHDPTSESFRSDAGPWEFERLEG